MTLAGLPEPEKWKRAPRSYDREMSLFVRGLHEHGDEMLERHPLLKLPSDKPRVSTPVAALILAWRRWEYMQGECPDCGAPAFGTSFGGLLSMGIVGGNCTNCARVVTRWIGGIALAVRGAQASVEGTPYQFKFVNMRWGFRGIPRSVVAALRKLGVKELPNARSGADEPVSGGAYYAMDGERIA